MIHAIPPAAVEEEPVLGHDVLLWRFDCLQRAGYPADVAVDLAKRGDVDLHDAVELLYRGCPVDTAARILSPTL